MLGAEVAPSPSFFPFKPHRLLMLRLMGFRSLTSFASAPVLPSTAILASISAFFLRMSSACSDMATSLFTFTSPPGLKVLLHISAGMGRYMEAL